MLKKYQKLKIVGLTGLIIIIIIFLSYRPSEDAQILIIPGVWEPPEMMVEPFPIHPLPAYIFDSTWYEAAALNLQGLAKMKARDTYGAIADFTKSIDIRGRRLQESHFLEARIDAYRKTRQWQRAIQDLDTAISLHIGGIVPFLTIKRFRALYPEYQPVPNETIARKLYQTFKPDWNPKEFMETFVRPNEEQARFGDALMTSGIKDLYFQRAGAYLNSGNWRKAASEVRRAMDGFPSRVDSVDRWHEVVMSGPEPIYVDLKTLDISPHQSAQFWIRSGESRSSNRYPVQKYEIDCAAGRVRMLSGVFYNDSGEPIGSHEGGKWAAIVPDSRVEIYFNGICRDKG